MEEIKGIVSRYDDGLLTEDEAIAQIFLAAARHPVETVEGGE